MSRFAIALLAGIGITAGSSQAYAQSSTTAGADNSDTNGGAIQEIIVTAEKRSDKLLTLPNAISVYSGDQLTQTGVKGVKDLTQVAPSLIWGDAGAEPRLSIRGIGNGLINIGAEAAVSLSVDGVPLASPLMSRRDFMDVGNVEVLRGPQGTVAGRNSPGGAINIYSNKPTDTPEGEVTLGYGNFNRKTIEAMVSGPIVGDTLLGRIAVSYVKDDGWLYDSTTSQMLNTQDAVHYRGYLMYKPSSTFNVSLIADGFEDKGFHIAGVDAGRVQPNYPSFSEYTTGGSSFDINTLTAKILDPGPFTSSGQQFTLRAEWDGGSAGKIVSTSAYQHFHQEGVRNYFAVPITYLPLSPSYLREDLKQLSQELTYTNDIGDRADIIVGALALSQRANEPFTLGGTSLNGIIPFVDRQKSRSIGLYAQFRYKLMDQLRITLGARETFDHKQFNETLFGLPTTNDGVTGSWKAFTPRVALDFTPTKDLTLYASVAKGYTGGGFNSFSGNEYKPEYVWSYEVGLKSYLFDRHVRFNLTAFHSDFKDIQSTVFETTSGGVASSLSVTNAGGAKIDGIEAELEVKASNSLRFNANGTWMNARYTELQSVDGSVLLTGTCDPANPSPTSCPTTLNLAGKKIPLSPKWQFNVGANYTAALSSDWNLDFAANYAWRSRVYFDFYNHPLFSQNGYGLLNGSITLSSTDKTWSLSVFGANLTNKRYWAAKIFGTGTGIPAAPTYTNGAVGEPRTYGIKLERRF